MAKRDTSISSLWSQLEFVCGGSDTDPCNAKLELEMSGRQVLYKCPHCGQTHTYYDVEKFVTKVTEILVDDEDEGCSTNLTNYQMKMMSRYDSRQHIFRVLSHTPTRMKVSIKNG